MRSTGRLGVLPPLPPAVHLRRPGPPAFPLGEPGCRLYARARHGLWQGVRASSLVEGDEVLAPAFHHGSEIEAFARAGLRCRFYELTDDLAPDEAELSALLGPRVRALHLVHYLGFPQDGARWRRWCDDRGLLLIEDAAQAWQSWSGERPAGSFGDISVWCIYKTVGVPDGAALLSRPPAPPVAGTRPLGAGPLVRRHGSWLLQRSGVLSGLRTRWRRELPFSHTDDIALGDPASPPSRATASLVSRLGTGAAARRREHYRALLDRLGELVPAPFADLPDGASPFAFPVLAPDKDELMGRLAEGGIDALSLWTFAHPCLVDPFPRAEAARARWVGLPVHQELRAPDLERLARAVLAALR